MNIFWLIYVRTIYKSPHYQNNNNPVNPKSFNSPFIQYAKLISLPINPFPMPSLKTNYIRTDITSQCFRYQFELVSNQAVDPKYYHQIQGYFLQINPFIVFSYPYFYSIQEMKQLKSFNYMLSNGQKVTVNILLGNTITLNSKEASTEIHKQLMKNTNFLYSQGLNICLNPFDERKLSYNTSVMPGFSITTEVTQNCIGFYLIPLEAKITEFHSLSTLHQHSIILDYSSGTFYQKLSIVRYDKQNQIVYFRTGQQVKKQYLKALQILPLNGFQLATRLSQYYKRLRQSQKLKKFIQKWQIKFDSRFMQLPYNFFPVSHIIFGNKQQKSLGECVGSINAYNFQYNFRKLLTNSSFDDTMRATIYFLLPQIHTPQKPQQSAIDLQQPLMQYYSQLIAEQHQWVMQVVNEMEATRSRMKLQECRIVVLRYDVYVGWVNGEARMVKQVQEMVEKEISSSNYDKVFVMSNYEESIREGRQQQIGSSVLPDSIKPLYKSLAQYFVQNGIYYHLLQAKQNDFRKCPDIVAQKTLAIIQCKLRLNPLKIKDIPFGTKPLMVVSLHVKQQTTGSVMVTAVGSLNAFLSKYTCSVHNCQLEKYQSTIVQTITQQMNKFNSIHKIYPKRIMIFRTGDFTHLSQTQFTLIQQHLIHSFSCKPTYILLTSQTALRVYNQIDYNYISKDTVKPTQLLCQIRYNSQRYLQLQSDSPMYKISVLGVDTNEVNFEEKVVELLTKLCFTYQVVGEMRFGKGLGFVGYGEKLYEWAKEFQSIKGMESHLRQGVMVFL